MLMNKTRIQKIILINWKGMFFQPFEIDEGMTILEGANGTGKTTIMIGAYTCLIPDLNYLSFQNVTTVSTRKNEDKGLYGRLGQEERNQDEPIYSLLDILTAKGERHLVGVKLIKKTYPQISLKHFAIKNLPLSADIEDILLNTSHDTQQQEIPELDEISEKSLKNGGEFINFRHAKEYFHFLYDNGISPLRLTETEERKRYNQLLHTSLYGGLSRSLQTSLRDYLLQEDNSLISNIKDMEQNLLSCRRTQSAIRRHHAVRETIRSIYQTGLELFSAGFFATRLTAENTLKKALELRRTKQQENARWNKLSLEITQIKDRLIQDGAALKVAVLETEQKKEKLAICKNAVNLVREINTKKIEHENRQKSAQKERQILEELKEKQDKSRIESQNLADQQTELSRKMANAGKAWETLSRQVGLYRQADELLQEAQTLLTDEALNQDTIEQRLAQTRHSFNATEEKHEKAYQDWNEAKLKSSSFLKYHHLLEELVKGPVSTEMAGETAKEKTDQFYQLENRLKKAKEIPINLEKIEKQIQKKAYIQQILSENKFSPIQSSAELDAHWETLIKENQQMGEKQKETASSLSTKEQEKNRLRSLLPELTLKLEGWERFQGLKEQLEQRTARTIHHTKELTHTRTYLNDQFQRLNLEKYRLEWKLKETQSLFNTLINEGSATAEIKNLAKEGHGTLLSERYESIPLEWAANLEGRLGPLINALVVKNIHTAADDISNGFNPPDDVWLVEEQDKEKLPEAREISDSILVKHGDAWRLTRLPEKPVLGEKARNEKIEFLREEVKRTVGVLEKHTEKIKEIEKSQSLINKIIPLEHLLSETSPLEELEEAKRRKPELKKEMEELSSQQDHFTQLQDRTQKQIDALQRCFSDKALLDQTRLEQEKKALLAELGELPELELNFQQNQEKVSQLRQGLDILQAPPLKDLSELEKSRLILQEQEDHLRKAVEVLQRLDKAKAHFQFADQVPLLEEKESLNQHLESQLDSIKDRQETLKRSNQNLLEKLKSAENLTYQEEKKLSTLDGQIKLLQDNLSTLEFSGSEDELNQAKKDADNTLTQKEKLESELGNSKATAIRLEADSKHCLESRSQAQSKWKRQYAFIGTSLQSWRAFCKQAKKTAQYDRLMADYYSTIQNSKKRADSCWQRSATSRTQLLNTLEKTPSAKPLLAKINALNPESEDDTDLNRERECLFIWQQIHGYLSQIIPADLETTDPEKAQQIITQKLDQLKENLDQQERGLRRNVESIPHNINNRVRKERSRIRKLNEKLEKVQFGFLQSIRIHVETQPELKRFLDILPQQLDIFTETNDENISIENLMADMYQKESGGKIRGELLLDYRHYVKMSIEVKREGTDRFEKVTSTNLSTGESIGVGIAILIIVLMSWEEQTRLIQESEHSDSLRFLLLDESSRLDQKALYTLNDFCVNMNLQLLIAAPSVERTLRGTTHHLTRGYYNGREEVVVRGRRVRRIDN